MASKKWVVLASIIDLFQFICLHDLGLNPSLNLQVDLNLDKHNLRL